MRNPRFRFRPCLESLEIRVCPSFGDGYGGGYGNGPTTTDQVAGTIGQNGWYTSPTVNVRLTASDSSSNVATTYYTIDGGSRQTYTGSPFAVAGDGLHTLTFFSVDAAGYTEVPEMDEVRIDSTAPHTTDTLSGTLGNGGWYTSASVAITLTAVDTLSGIDATYYKLDDGARQEYMGSPITVAGAGQHRISYWSVDGAGNTEQPAGTDSFKIDDTPPVTSASLSGTPGGVYISNAVVTLTASDAGSGVAGTYYAIDGGSQQTYSGSFDVSGVGLHKIAFWSSDNAGNTATATTDQFTIDAPEAQLAFGTGLPSQVTVGGKFAITVDAQTPDGDLDVNNHESVALVLVGSTKGKLTGTVIEPVQNGVATFTGLSLTSAGTYQLLAASTSDLRSVATSLTAVRTTQSKAALASAVSNPSDPSVRASVPARSVGIAADLRLTGVPLFAVSGTEHITVTATDASGNTIKSGFTDKVTFAGQTYTCRRSDHGVHSFTVNLSATGTQTLTAMDATNARVNSGSANTTVVGTPTAITTDPLDGTKTALVVVAPARGGTVVVTPTDGTGTSVFVAMTIGGKTVTTGPFAPTGHIFVYGRGGADTLQLATNSQGATIAIPALLFAGSGKDTLSAAGSSANNVLVGGPSADRLMGGSGRDILIGGAGAARLQAGSGDDILIAGQTVYDASLPALADLIAEWGRADRTPSSRIHALFGDGTGGLNSFALLNAQTVLGDNGGTQIIGNPTAADWFWFTDNAKGADKLSDYAPGDTATF
jgi:RTX calcium-binding nonapeptide repeat (4 copies)